MLAFIVGMQAEALLLKPLNARVFIGGGSAPGARQACRRAIEAGARALVSFGLAGGLSPSLAPGALIVPSRVIKHGRQLATDPQLSAALGGITSTALLASDSIVASVAGKAERWADMQADAVDMESGAVAEAARDAYLPFAVLRAICDPANRALPPAATAALSRAGNVAIPRMLASVLFKPGQVSDLLALARDAAAARKALKDRVAELQASKALNNWSGSTTARF